MSGEPNDERALAAWRAAFAAGRRADPAPCPPDEALAALATGELGGEERERVADHVVACPRCAATYRALLELHAESTRFSASRRRRTWGWAAAAVIVLAAGLALLAGRATGPGLDRDVRRSGGLDEAVSPAPGSVLAAPPPGLRWTAEPGAARGRVRLFDARAELVWESRFEGAPAVDLPRDVGARLEPGAAYYWVVETDPPAARERRGPYWFELAAR